MTKRTSPAKAARARKLPPTDAPGIEALATSPVTPTTIGRPRWKHPPADAARRIEAFAADGFSKVGVAMGLGVVARTLDKWLDEDATLQEAFARGRERERHALHNLLYRQAVEKGNVVAALFLLKARHGYREGDQSESTNRVSINFTLPGALSRDEFAKLTRVVNPSESVPDATRTETQLVPTSRIERS